MDETLNNLKEIVVNRRNKWEVAKDNRFPTSIFVCNRRIQKLNEALELINDIEVIDEYTKIGQ